MMHTQDLQAFAVPLKGTMLVEASAGTGKTHTITSLFVRLVLEHGLSVREVLVVTFTEAATAELRDRIRRRLRTAVDALSGKPTPRDPELAAFAARVSAGGGEGRALHLARATAALRELDLAAISTIHAFCLRMLQEHAFESGARFGLELMADTSLLVREVGDDYWASRVYELEPSLYASCSSRKKRFDLDTARQLVSAFAKLSKDVPVLPARAPADPRELRDAIGNAYRAAQKLWKKDGHAVRARLHTTGALSEAIGNYSTEAIDAYCTELDEYFRADAVSFLRPLGLAKLTPSALRAATKSKKITPSHAFFEAAGALDALLESAADALVVGLRRGAVDYVRSELPRRKEALRAQSFEDLLHSLDRALSGPRGRDLRARIADRFRAALIDEFQDTDPVQFRIFRELFHASRSDAPLLLVGDPKQAIYAFRGGDVFSYIAAASASAGPKHTLGENRRSDPSLVKAVNTIFARARDPFMLADIEFHPVSAHAPQDRIVLGEAARTRAALEVLFLPRPPTGDITKGWLDTKLPAVLAREISRFLASGATVEGEPVRPGHIAVLTRRNQQARKIQAELRKLRIPTTLQSDESVFHSAEAEDVELLLRAILEPTHDGAVRAALATTVAGLTANELLALDASETEWDKRSETFRSWQAHWDEHGFVHAYRRMLTELGAEERLLALVDGERRITNILHLGELLHSASARDKLGRTALVRWLGLMRAEERPSSELGNEASELRLESDAHAVKLLTIHKSKGLEFPIVYCPALWDSLLPTDAGPTIAFHDKAADSTLKIDIAPEKGGESIACATEECIAENQRLLYVALTRAKHRCSIVWGGINKAERSALAYTLHQGEATAAVESLSQRAAARYDSLDDDGLRRDLATLASASGGTIGVVDLVDAAGIPYEPTARAAISLSARVFQRARIDTWFRVGSFTAFTSSSNRRPTAAPEVLGRDRDEAEERSPHRTSLLPPPVVVSAEPVLLHAFPRGTKPGTMLHSILEEYDFRSTDPDALPSLVAAKLAAAGYSNDEWGDVLVRGLRAMLATPLDAKGLTLASISRADRIDELEFVLPVARESSQLTAASLADALAAHGSTNVPHGYAEQVRALAFVPLRGFLKGFIDLIFRHEGRFYVVDYKSNHLGTRAEDYSSARLAEEMGHHHYFLQYHLYVLALHRWLGQRLREYDYEQHFGGVLYLFVRGMSPDHARGKESGVFRDRPSRELIEALGRAAHG